MPMRSTARTFRMTSSAGMAATFSGLKVSQPTLDLSELLGSYTQFSTASSGTRLKCRVLFVTTVNPSDNACAATRVS